MVRTLADFTPPMTVPQLAHRSGASTGATYRVVEFLAQEGLIERTPRGPISTVAWRRMLERRAAGCAVVFASADLDELMEYSDELLVFFAGRVSPRLPRAGLSAARLAELIGGVGFSEG